MLSLFSDVAATTMTTPAVPSSDRIANLALDTFKKLPKTGKPSTNEWTVLSSILKYDCKYDVLEVVSIGTGTKCLGKDYALSASGEIINDSHAEVMARRGLLRYIMESIKKRNHFSYDDTVNKFRLDSNISFHFFTTHPPCGDASIFDVTGDDEPKCKRQKLDLEDDNIGGKILPSNNTTGGKLIETEVIDLMSQDIGEIRTKPGKGIRTLSVSCSDKLSRWNILGVQGALLDSLLDCPVYLKSLTICGVSCVASIERAIWKRWIPGISVDFSELFNIQHPIVQVTSEAVQFEFSKKSTLSPSPNSIVWCNVDNRKFEVSVGGRRQGVTKKNINTVMGRLFICKKELFKQFLELVLNDPSNVKLTGFTSSMAYSEAKNIASSYRSTWCFLKEKVFKKWTVKTNIFYDFKLNEDFKCRAINEATM